MRNRSPIKMEAIAVLVAAFIVSTVQTPLPAASIAVRAPFSEVNTAVQNPFSDVSTADRNPFSNAKTAVRNTLTDVSTAVRNPLSDVSTAVRNPLSDVNTAVREPLSDANTAVRNPLSDVSTAVQNPLSDVSTAVRNPISDVNTAVRDPISDVNTAERDPISDVSAEVRAPFSDMELEHYDVDCGPCKCNMRTKEAYCRYCGLKYIPPLPAGIEMLFFEYNSLVSITNRTFQNISHLALTALVLNDNGIREISIDAFQKLNISRLEVLSFKNNWIHVQSVAQILKVIGRFPQLMELNLDYLNLSVVPENFLEGLNGSSVVVLLLSDNHVKEFSLTYISNMPRLNYLYLRGNLFLEFDTNLPSPTNITKLGLNYNVLQAIPNFCQGTNNFPVLQTLSLAYNRIFLSQEHSLSCLMYLEELDLSGNMLLTLNPNMVWGLRSLKSIRMNYMRPLGNIPRQWAASAFNNSWVTEVRIINSGIRIGHDNFSVDIFQGCSGLRSLYLGENFFTDASDDFFYRLFQPIEGLTFLDLSSVGLTTVPRAIGKLVHLKEIWLFNNYIVWWDSDVFNHLVSLSNISMDNNQITTVKEDSFPAALVENLRALNLSENPFSCTCDLLWFVQWIKHNSSTFTGSTENYRCASPYQKAGQSLVTLDFTETTCLLGEEDLDLIIVICSIFIVFSVIAPLLFRYRWHLQSAVFLMRYRALREESRRGRAHYDYDAFLIYAETERSRVRQQFLPRLEMDRHMTLCCHERDFLPGKTIIDNIVDCMLASRCVVVLLSNALATSEWCQFELNLAHAEVMESGAAPLVLLLLEDIAPHNMTPTLYAVLKTTTYLRYPTLPQDMDVFWEHVHQALADQQ